jgi:NAD(P)-dependent dehydrogenase (short-subunit alcohol dehydrogenase family)/acyl carrier protein
LGFNSLLFLTQAIDDQLAPEPIQIKVISDNLQEVTGEELLCPEKAILLGPCRVASQEYPHIQCTSIDIVISKAVTEQEQQLDLLMEELTTRNSEPIVAYRGKHRWVQTFEAIRLEKDSDPTSRLRQNGVYFITGGLGGIGLALAEHLAQTVRAKLVLTARTMLPARNEWDDWLKTHDEEDPISRKIQRVQSIEELGAEVLALRADVTDADQMKAAIEQTYDRFGPIHGVIHAAGVAGGGMMQLKTFETAEGILAPKVKGTLVLAKLLHESKLEFFVLCSSINSIVGGVGQVDYCAANAFLDAYAHKHNSKNNALSINWCAWQEVGMAVNTVVPEDLKEERDQSLKFGILPDEGKEAFSRILNSSFPQVIVSTQDFLPRMEMNQKAVASDSAEKTVATAPPKATYARPNLSSVYVVPGNQTEQTIAEIWQQVLGMEKVGIHDNFFDLGGHSLLVAKVIAHLRDAFPVEFPMGTLFERPTVHLLSKMILEEQERGPSFVESSSRGRKRKERRLRR